MAVALSVERMVEAPHFRINPLSMKSLVDFDVISEVTQGEPDASVMNWLRRQEPDLAVTTFSLGEIQYDIGLTASRRKRKPLEIWFEEGRRGLRVPASIPAQQPSGPCFSLA